MHGAELVDETPDALRDPSAGSSSAPRSEPFRNRRCWRWGGMAALFAVFPVVGIVGGLARGGWFPTGDEAVIAWRSWDMFTDHRPLVGQFTFGGSLGSNQPVFDPGPLLYEVIALPARLAPGIGPVIAIQLLVALSLLVACVAAVDVAGRWAGLAVAAGGLLLEWSLAGQLAGAPIWNPHAPLIPFAATLVVAWAVAAGHLWWTAPLVFLSSFCMQAHLMFALPAAAVLLVAVLVGVLAGRTLGRPLLRPTLVAAGVGVLCWAPSVVQQLRTHPGNLTLLSRSTVTTQPFGWRFALGQLGRGLDPTTLVWLRAPEQRTLVRFGAPGLLTLTSALVMLVALAVLAVFGLMRRNYRVAGLAAVALTADLATTLFFSHFPTNGKASLSYAQRLIWPVGLFSWCALVVGVVAVVQAGRSRARVGGEAPGRARIPGARQLLASGSLAAGCLAVVSLVLTAFLYQAGPTYELKAGERPDQLAAASRLVALVPAPARRGQRLFIRVPVRGGFDGLMDVAWELDAAYQLRLKGWTPVLKQDTCGELEAVYCGRPTDMVVEVGDQVPSGAQVLGTIPTPSRSQPIRRLVWVTPATG